MINSHASETPVLTSLEPTSTQAAWTQLQYGLFIHFGPNTIEGVMWGDGKFPAERFAPESIDCKQWANMAAEAGMRYAVFTTKHHDGFCMWPTAHTEYCVRNSPGQPDVVEQFVSAFRDVGIEVGFYYSLWDHNCSFYQDDDRYADYMMSQLEELLTQYGPVLELWFDGGWDKDYPSTKPRFEPHWLDSTDASVHAMLRGERWRWNKLYDFIHGIQPDCLVLNNSGTDRPGELRYPPADLRSGELFDCIYYDQLYKPQLSPIVQGIDNKSTYVPLEFCASLTPDWFWKKGKCYAHLSARALAEYRQRAIDAGANLLLNIGPDASGKLPEVHRPFLADAENRVGHHSV